MISALYFSQEVVTLKVKTLLMIRNKKLSRSSPKPTCKVLLQNKTWVKFVSVSSVTKNYSLEVWSSNSVINHPSLSFLEITSFHKNHHTLSCLFCGHLLIDVCVRWKWRRYKENQKRHTRWYITLDQEGIMLSSNAYKFELKKEDHSSEV